VQVLRGLRLSTGIVGRKLIRWSDIELGNRPYSRRVKSATWTELLLTHSVEVQGAARALEAMIRDELPDVVVDFDPGNALLAFGRSMKMRDLLFALIPHAAWVNLQLAAGALLPNPDGLIEGTGKRIRHVKVRSAAAVADPKVRSIVRAQIALGPSPG
jgi:hypothetical protein